MQRETGSGDDGDSMPALVYSSDDDGEDADDEAGDCEHESADELDLSRPSDDDDDDYDIESIDSVDDLDSLPSLVESRIRARRACSLHTASMSCWSYNARPRFQASDLCSHAAGLTSGVS